MSVWLEALGRVSGEFQARVASGLMNAGVLIHPIDPASPGGPGLVLFTEVTPDLCGAVGELSRRGLERVLAIGSSADGIRSGGWRLLSVGASDVFQWNEDTESARAVAARLERWGAVDAIARSPLVQENLVGQSPSWIAVVRRIVEVARFSDSAVLVMGESGTGKELVARLIHTLDARTGKKELVVVDCTTIVPELAGSELFGHERGAFTGAISERDGAFALADGGTLFLDEIGELPISLQAELLRAVQEGTYKRVGGNTWRRAQFRLVSATNRDLLAEQERGRFRRDLYYRIASWTCVLPPLRERSEDILPLVHEFVRRLRPDLDRSCLDAPVREYYLRRPCPGNVRDLKQVVAQMVRRHVGPGPFTIGDIPEDQRPYEEQPPATWPDTAFEREVRRAVTMGIGLKEIGRVAEDLAVGAAMENEGNNVHRAAARLRVTDRAVQLRQRERRRKWGANSGYPPSRPEG